ncbi:N-acetyltransferase [Sporolactobacillus sp. CPB3-1]|uniref:N-acetyltransferase n=1 Tax=Sporolactobacillus mangiferae TaxID=2940498 RepID=A0ABT0MCM2_9BACL|nr:GNAT family N-acetyltransferase [Sporolactobacillus mangiferae]MCL1632619.1 N-acetyltransferase [Sporolactobacillus mangiferae]
MEIKQGIQRFYMLDGNKEIGEVTFTEEHPLVLSINHTYVDPHYRGKHIAKQLIQAVVDLAVKEHKTIDPVCSYAKAWFQRNESAQAILYKKKP